MLSITKVFSTGAKEDISPEPATVTGIALGAGVRAADSMNWC